MTPAMEPQVSGKLWINGEWRDALSGKTFATANPATEETIANVAEADAADAAHGVGVDREPGPPPGLSGIGNLELADGDGH